MRLLITGICGFAGSAIALELQRRFEGLELLGIDNLSRAGSELNRAVLKSRGIRCYHGDLRNASDVETLPPVDWVIDAAANPSVLAGVAGGASSRQLLEHNLLGTVNLLEYARRHASGVVLLSTSRVYSARALGALPVGVRDDQFVPDLGATRATGFSEKGVTEDFSTEPPLSLYGSTKRASEILALEYAAAFDLPVFVNRCGVLAGAGQFGKADQGIFSFWIHSLKWKRPLKYIGFGGKGHQVRDCLHPRDLAQLIAHQVRHSEQAGSVTNVSGGVANSSSLARLTEWCSARFGPSTVGSDPVPRRYDVPWLVLDSTLAEARFGWRPETRIEAIFEEIAAHAEQHPEWLELVCEP